MSSVIFNGIFQGRTEHREVHPGLNVARHHFIEPYPFVKEIERLSLVTMDLLNQFGYPYMSGYAKFTVTLTILNSTTGENIISTIGVATPLTHPNNSLIERKEVYSRVYDSLSLFSEKYEGELISKLMIQVYMDGKKEPSYSLSEDERRGVLSSICQERLSEYAPISVLKVQNKKKKRNYTKKSYITATKPSGRKRKSFLVADLETIQVDKYDKENISYDKENTPYKAHTPYAAGLMMVCPGEKINDIMIETFFSEDYSIILDKFEDRSTKLLYDLIVRISIIARKDQSVLTIYFHNFSRFDGIILLKHITLHHKNYRIKTLMRNLRLYELTIYDGKKLLFRFRDSLNLLPGKLSSLGRNLCPELGEKGSINHDEVDVTNLKSNKKILLDYMKQDILLLGGVMQKAQEIYNAVYNVDIESKITVSSLALSIFRMKYSTTTLLIGLSTSLT